MAAHLESVRRALAQQDAEVDRFKAIIQENSALNERILEHEDTIARQAAALSTLRSEADDTMTARAAQTAARRLEQQNASLQRDLSAAHEAPRCGLCCSCRHRVVGFTAQRRQRGRLPGDGVLVF